MKRLHLLLNYLGKALIYPKLKIIISILYIKNQSKKADLGCHQSDLWILTVARPVLQFLEMGPGRRACFSPELKWKEAGAQQGLIQIRR